MELACIFSVPLCLGRLASIFSSAAIFSATVPADWCSSSGSAGDLVAGGVVRIDTARERAYS